jgi:hypothetical protein
MRRINVILAISLVGIVGIVGIAFLVTPTSSRPSLVKVKFVDLPTGVAGNAVVTAPDHTVRKISHDETVGTSPGLYRLEVGHVEVAGNRYFPEHPQMNVVVRGGTSRTIIVDYANIVPNTTIILSGNQLGAGTDVAGGIVILKRGSSTVTNGQVLTAGATPLTPEGLLVRAIAVAQQPDGSQLVVVNSATLPEAMTRARFSVSFALRQGGGQQLASAPLGGQGAPFTLVADHFSRTSERARLADQTLFALKYDFQKSVGESAVGCNNSGPEEGNVDLSTQVASDINIDAGFDIKVTAHLSASWGWAIWDGPSVKFWITTSESAHTGIDGSYSVDYPEPAITLAEIPVDIGIPLVLTPKLAWETVLEGEVHGEAKFAASQSGSLTAGFEVQNGSIKPVINARANLQASAHEQLDAKASVSAGPKFLLDIDDIGGPTAVFNVKLEESRSGEANASVGSGGIGASGSASASLALSGNIDVGAEIDVFGLVNLSQTFASPEIWKLPLFHGKVSTFVSTPRLQDLVAPAGACHDSFNQNSSPSFSLGQGFSVSQTSAGGSLPLPPFTGGATWAGYFGTNGDPLVVAHVWCNVSGTGDGTMSFLDVFALKNGKLTLVSWMPELAWSPAPMLGGSSPSGSIKGKQLVTTDRYLTSADTANGCGNVACASGSKSFVWKRVDGTNYFVLSGVPMKSSKVTSAAGLGSSSPPTNGPSIQLGVTVNVACTHTDTAGTTFYVLDTGQSIPVQDLSPPIKVPACIQLP